MNNATAETNKEEDNAICVLFYHPILGKNIFKIFA
jgi:hypothetical protein